MRRRSLFWAVILIVAGVLLLLGNLGILKVNIWDLIWPAALIALGLWILSGIVFGRRSARGEAAVIPLEDAGQARIRVRHGAGCLRIGAGAGPDELVSGTFGGGLDYQAKRDGETLAVEMRMLGQGWDVAMPWNWGRGTTLDWTFNLNNEISLTLELETGVGDSRLDLADLQVTDLKLKTGASATDVTLPANAGHTRVAYSGGAASVIIRVPSGVAARIKTSGGLSETKVDRSRFPRMGDVYQSEDYDTALNKADIKVEIGVGSVDVR